MFFQIEGVKSQRFAFSQKNPSKGLAGVAIRVGVVDVNDMQLASGHEFGNILTRRREVPFHIKGRTSNPQLVCKLGDVGLLLNKRRFVVDA